MTSCGNPTTPARNQVFMVPMFTNSGCLKRKAAVNLTKVHEK